MIFKLDIDRLSRHPWGGAFIYLMLVATLCLTTIVLLMDVAERFAARDATQELLDRTKMRTQARPSGPKWLDPWPPGSPVFEGQTATIASAALLQRINGAILQVGGTIVSTEVDLQGSASKDGVLKVVANCEIEQTSLLQLLYDVETGMPFLFVEQLLVQNSTAVAEGGRMRVLIGVSGLWRGEK